MRTKTASPADRRERASAPLGAEVIDSRRSRVTLFRDRAGGGRLVDSRHVADPAGERSAP